MLPIRTLVFALVVDWAAGFATSAVPARHLSISKWGNHRISATHNVRALLAHAHGEADARRRAASTGHARIIGVASDRTPIYDCFEDEIQEALPQLDEQGGHYGVTPDSDGEQVYHYHMPAHQVSTIHFAARKAIGRRKLDLAQKLYSEAIAKSHSSYARTFLLSALLQQRCGDIDRARMFFRIGSRIHPTNDQLLCAWGLMESKHGHPHECVRLLTSAVRLNPTRHKALLKWKGLKSIGSIKPSSRVLDQINTAEQQQATQNETMTPLRTRQGSILNVPPSTQDVVYHIPHPDTTLNEKESCRKWVAAETVRLEAERGPYPGWKKIKRTLEQLEQLTVCDAYTASLSQSIRKGLVYESTKLGDASLPTFLAVSVQEQP